MVRFNIFFEPVQKFNERVVKLDNYVSFNEVIISPFNSPAFLAPPFFATSEI